LIDLRGLTVIAHSKKLGLLRTEKKQAHVIYLLLFKFQKKLPEPLIVLAAAVIGLIIYPLVT
jgi:hypothetical protein